MPAAAGDASGSVARQLRLLRVFPRAFDRFTPWVRLARAATEHARGAAACRPRTPSPMPRATPHVRPWWTRPAVRLATVLLLPLLSACGAGRGAPAGPLPHLAEYQGREVASVSFEGELLFPTDSLRAVVTTRRSRCRLLSFLPFCVFGRDSYKLDLNVLARDVVRIQLFYRDQGRYGTRVFPFVEEAERPDWVDVRFAVEPGDLVILRELTLEGTEDIVPPEELIDRMPLEEGEPFRRLEFVASADTVRNFLLDRGYAYAQMLRNYEIDTIADVAAVNLVAVPGPLVTVDTVIFAGLYRLNERTARRQLALREGDLMRSTELQRSQRNLFDLALVQFASVEVAPEEYQLTPDSLQLHEDSIGSSLLVRIVEAPRYAADASFGYATRECFRAQGTNTDRNFLGGARRLEVSGMVSKLGVGQPFGGLENSVCRAFRLDERATAVDTTIARAMNHRLALNFVQPQLFRTQTTAFAGAYTERISELDLYLRDSKGGEVGAARQIAPQTLATLSLDVRRGRTTANDFFFCLAYDVCTREDIELLRDARWSNRVQSSLTQNRIRLEPFPSSGHRFRVQTDYASALLGSDDEYLRVVGDAIRYQRLGGEWVLSGRVAAGTFLEGIVNPPDGYVPPDRRFYGGGPNHVRGYRFNELGPKIYIRRIERRPDRPDTTRIDFSATGGTRTLLASGELTGPSPVLGNILRVAAFVDAGRVWESRDTLAVQPPMRVTPGVGLRVATPVGPLRFDVGYNPYRLEPGPLYGIDEAGQLLPEPLNPRYVPPDTRGFFRRLVFQVSVGQPL
jgi:outer membrane protein insertion porin family